jgi:hypothetical protein
MTHKGVIFGVVLLFIFYAIAQADLNPVKDEEKNVDMGTNSAKVEASLEGYEEAKSEPRYSVDQDIGGGFHCCIPGTFGACWRWCINNAEGMEGLEKGGETQHSVDQYVGSPRRCCSWGPRKKCVRWC